MASTHFPFLYAAFPYRRRKEFLSIQSGLTGCLQLTASLASDAFFALGIADIFWVLSELYHTAGWTPGGHPLPAINTVHLLFNTT